MSLIPISVLPDHLEALIASRQHPMSALAELVWNSLDADADRVSIRFDRNKLGGLHRIRVKDNGHGIPFSNAKKFFGNLGGSWKKIQKRTPGGRGLHGKSGKGRFIAFALGDIVEWKTTSAFNGGLIDFSIKGTRSALKGFELSESNQARSKTAGTEVVITNLPSDFPSLTDFDSAAKFANAFALYLCEYPGIVLEYDGERVDPEHAQKNLESYNLGEIKLSEGKTANAVLTVIEWRNQQDRALHLCDANGISLYSVPPNIHAPGFNFTAYLKSDVIRDLDKDGLLIFDDAHPDVKSLVDAARGAIKSHFRQRTWAQAAALVQEWKTDKVYPYEGDPRDAIETAERPVFDVIALNINSYLANFDEGTNTSKRFTFSLVKQALTENPESLQKIFEDILQLPKDRQDELAELLEKTSLPAIITSARVVADRLNFLRGLQMMLFDKESKQKLLERDHLQKILAKETWIFGEQFNLTSNEDTLNEVLEKHRHLLGLPYDDDSNVTLEGGGTGRIDLMLARSIPQPDPNEREYLVVELKRPSKKIDLEVISQIKRYALAVSKDERFKDTRTSWVFLTVSNAMTDDAAMDSQQTNRPKGLVQELDGLRVWAKSWGQIIQDCQGRLDFFKGNLQYEADRDSATAYLRKAHEKYLPHLDGGHEIQDEDLP